MNNAGQNTSKEHKITQNLYKLRKHLNKNIYI